MPVLLYYSYLLRLRSCDVDVVGTKCAVIRVVVVGEVTVVGGAVAVVLEMTDIVGDVIGVVGLRPYFVVGIFPQASLTNRLRMAANPMKLSTKK